MPFTLNLLNPVNDINNVVDMVNQAGPGVVAPEVFYSNNCWTRSAMMPIVCILRLADPAPTRKKQKIDGS